MGGRIIDDRSTGRGALQSDYFKDRPATPREKSAPLGARTVSERDRQVDRRGQGRGAVFRADSALSVRQRPSRQESAMNLRSRWGMILAGGDGARLRSLTRRIAGD